MPITVDNSSLEAEVNGTENKHNKKKYIYIYERTATSKALESEISSNDRDGILY